MPTEAPTVSVVMPVYNVKSFLEEAIQSVLDQSLYDLELILVNDGSTDGSDEICRKCAKTDRRILYVEQKNSGVSVARNRGMDTAKGKYLFFMDSDDTIDKNFLSSSLDIAEKKGSDIIVLGDYYCKRMPNAPAFPTWALFIRLEFLHRFPDIKYPVGIQPCEDGLFTHQLLALTDKVAENSQARYYYRQHEYQNHMAIQRDSWKVLQQIPVWFEILELFYQKYQLHHSHYMHLARFIEHEPFEFRYLGISLDIEQRAFLYTKIHAFFDKHVAPKINKQEMSTLSKDFRYFLKSEDHKNFDLYYSKRKKNKELYSFFVNFVPLRGLRRKWLKAVEKKFRS